MEVIIVFAKEGERSPVLDVMAALQQRAFVDEGYRHLALLVTHALKFLKAKGVPEVQREMFTTVLDSGRLYSIQLVKELRNHPPLLEFRVNWREAGAFRAIFFTHQAEETQFLFFVRAMIKSGTYSPVFERLIRESEQFYAIFIMSPEEHLPSSEGR